MFKFLLSFFTILALAILPDISPAQQLVERSKKIHPVVADSVYFIDFLVEPGSLELFSADTLIGHRYWQFEEDRGTLTWNRQALENVEFDSVLVRYEAIPLTIERRFRLREIVEEEVDTLETDVREEEVFREQFTQEDLFGDVDLNRSGSLSRGFTVGNRQDLSLESGLRLDMSGQLTEEIEILATLTDRSTPIQPDGTTQTLREFDRVYIRMRGRNSQVELGDVDVDYTDSAFARVSRRVQGGTGMSETGFGDYSGAVSVARGQFRTMRFQGQEGYQGPYRLTGENNEQFIIVLAGTERVYINGEQVSRGVENEYTIDYSLGELTFTNNLLVTDETRIVIEYQYITQNFTRTLFATEGREDELFGGRMEFAATYIREADNDNVNTQLQLSEEDIELLRQLGDEVEDTFISGADSVGFRQDADFLLYARQDTVFEGETYEIYKHLPGDPSGVYRVRFSNVGPGNGSYRRVGGTANGILYEWAGPDMGSYEPVRRLQAPERHQMMAVRSGFRLTDQIRLHGEWAVSDFDQNRFSSLDNEDNIDHGFVAGIESDRIHTALGDLRFHATQRYTGKRFRYFERVRDVEFDRKWNVPVIDGAVEEWIREAEIGYFPLEATELAYEFGQLERTLFTGNRHRLQLESRETGAPQARIKTELVRSNDTGLEEEGRWFRQQGNSEQKFESPIGNLVPFFRWELENRRQRDAAADSLTPGSFEFYEWNPGFRIERSEISFSFGSAYRTNRRAFNGNMRKESESWTQSAAFNYNPDRSFQSQNRVSYRQKETAGIFLPENGSSRSQSILFRSVNNYYLFNDGLEGELLYEANTERRSLLQETYVEVGPEIGQYVWVDLNDDGVRQVDEFFPEVTPNEGTFIRQFIPSDELLPVVDLNTRLRARVDPSRFLDSEGTGLMGFLGDTRWNTLIELRETSTEEELGKVYTLSPAVIMNEESTLNGQFIFQQDMRWVPSHQRYDLTISVNHLESMFRRAAGMEQRRNRSYRLEGGYRLTESFRLILSLRSEDNRFESSRFETRNYDILTNEIRPGIRFIAGRSLQTDIRTGWAEREDRFPDEPAGARTVRIENNTQWTLFGRLQNNIRLQWRNTKINGIPSELGRFELTEGTGEGTSFVWNINSTYRISTLLRANLQYSGRVGRRGNPVQTMRIVVNAIF